MSVQRKKEYKVDFFAVAFDQSMDHSVMLDLLRDQRGYTEPKKLDSNDDEIYQVRSIVSTAGGRCFRGVFGRCRFNETPEQGTSDGKDADVRLKPGYGLVQKNHFLFYPTLNLLVYQRNPIGSHYSKFQRYLRLVVGAELMLEPILTMDSYNRLLGGDVHVRRFSLSFLQPRDPSMYADNVLGDAVALVNRFGGVSASITISVGRTKRRLIGQLKSALVGFARDGVARVARAYIDGESEAIDLIANRITETISVRMQENGRPDAEDIYASLSEARDKRNPDIKTFFGQ